MERRLIEELRAIEQSYPQVPCFKFEDEVERYLNAGYVDFIATVPYWRGSRPPERRGMIIPTRGWGVAKKGYIVRAMTLDGALRTVNYIIEDYRRRGEEILIYFRIRLPCDRIRGGISWVDMELEMLNKTIEELSKPIPRREYYDI